MQKQTNKSVIFLKGTKCLTPQQNVCIQLTDTQSPTQIKKNALYNPGHYVHEIIQKLMSISCLKFN